MHDSQLALGCRLGTFPYLKIFLKGFPNEMLLTIQYIILTTSVGRQIHSEIYFPGGRRLVA